MATLDKRISDLEAHAANTHHSVRMYLCDEGDDAQQARAKAGVPLDYAGKVVRVQFVSSPNALKENHHGHD